MDDTLLGDRRTAEPRPLLADVADALRAAADALRTADPTHAGHRTWCVPAMHADGDDRCVNAAVDVAPHVASWLVERNGRPMAVIDAAAGVELSLHPPERPERVEGAP
ncbi:MAG: hypothetical protein ACRCTR_07110 [Actinomycetota bacterium]